MTGKHLLIDLWMPDGELLQTVEPLWSRLLAATRASGAEILHAYVHQFTPQGMSGLIMIAESHVSIHTWPEEGYLAMDILSCGHVDPEVLVREFTRGLQVSRRRVSLQTRGNRSSSAVYTQEDPHG
jgi:S-adenosylmethionine decarboxylase proenzyme